MHRTIIEIDAEKCNGCGLCAEACHEGAIGMADGKAILLRDDYCDGLGDCLPACPAGAISFVEREAAAYDEAAVKKRMEAQKTASSPCACPGAQTAPPEQENSSQLRQWPVQIKLTPPGAPFFKDADLLIAADCTAFACGDFHNRFMKNRVTIIACPKLDAVDYSEKLTAILRNNSIKSVTVLRMEVPCCGGIVYAVEQALKNSGKEIPLQTITLSTEGTVLDA